MMINVEGVIRRGGVIIVNQNVNFFTAKSVAYLVSRTFIVSKTELIRGD